MHLENFANQASQEIAELKEKLATEAGKRDRELWKQKTQNFEATKKKIDWLAQDCEESLLKVTENFEATKMKIAEKKEALVLRAENTETKLGVVEEELKGIKDHVTQVYATTFGKLAFSCRYSLNLALCLFCTWNPASTLTCFPFFR